MALCRNKIELYIHSLSKSKRKNCKASCYMRIRFSTGRIVNNILRDILTAEKRKQHSLDGILKRKSYEAVVVF